MGPVGFESPKMQPGRAGQIDAREDEQQAATNAEAEAAACTFDLLLGGPLLGGPYVEDPAVWALYFGFWGLGGAVGPLALQMRCLEQRPACLLKGIPWTGVEHPFGVCHQDKTVREPHNPNSTVSPRPNDSLNPKPLRLLTCLPPLRSRVKEAITWLLEAGADLEAFCRLSFLVLFPPG